MLNNIAIAVQMIENNLELKGDSRFELERLEQLEINLSELRYQKANTNCINELAEKIKNIRARIQKGANVNEPKG
ncbi:hypothetical protein [Anaeromusa acidaminophila]|uniref:hypothetical protein n=1 Tax=Anaeromusa acidaminophila TaxID=81464 RepID=UPI0012EA0C3D|nr:hypothetical protein [Anaeromusa acidaminophila]